jgi:hypothetical protein
MSVKMPKRLHASSADVTASKRSISEKIVDNGVSAPSNDTVSTLIMHTSVEGKGSEGSQTKEIEVVDSEDEIKIPVTVVASNDTITHNTITTPDRATDTSSLSSLPHSPTSCARSAGPHEHPSPTNREKFMAGLHVQTIGCCLNACTVGPNVRLTFTGTVVVLYPINLNPDRRYVVFMDENGFTGITIWSSNLKKIASNSIGKLCEITKVNLSTHQGKRTLNLSKESEVTKNNLYMIFYSQF